ncbi:MAG: NADH-quinone oxidoreductase subunit H, partial [Gammaproteobacteria bacterium]
MMLEWLRNGIIQPATTFLFPATAQPYAALTVETVIKIIVILVPLLVTVAILPYFERKIIGFMQDRIGPNRVGLFGLRLWGFGQPFADAIKLFLKEIITPSGASKVLFFAAPVLSVAPSLAAWAVIPFDDVMVLSNINAGLLYILA